MDHKQREIVELVGNYDPNCNQIGTAHEYFVPFFSKMTLTLAPIHGVEGTSDCPFSCEIETEPHDHSLGHCDGPDKCDRIVRHEHVVGKCEKACVHGGDDSGPNDNKYDFTIRLETSDDKKTWRVAATCKVLPDDYGPFTVSADLKKAKWARIMAESHNHDSNADIMLTGYSQFE